MATNKIPIEWDERAVALLSEIAPDDVEGAKVWWETFAPAIYAGMLEALPVDDSSPLRGDISRYVRQADLSTSQKQLAKAGLLMLFIGGRYYTIRGTRLGDARVISSLNRALVGSRPQTMGLCNALRKGDVSLRDWQMQMKNNVIVSQVAAGVVGAGGEQSVTPAVMAKIRDNIAIQLEYLGKFAAAIAGGMTIDGTVCRLMKMYINSARGTYHAVDGLIKGSMGYTLYANVLGAGEAHCEGGTSCQSVTDKGFRPVGSLPPIGTRTCLSNCLCHWVYMNPVTEEMW